MIDELRKIGLNDLEARCYLVLHEEPGISGYEVAKKVSVSRTNVYAALRALTDKGVCRMIEGEPVIYEAVPAEQLVRLLKADFEQNSRSLLGQLNSPPRAAKPFYSWHGEKAVGTAIRRCIANAQKCIVADLWAEDLPWAEEALLQAEERGVAVTVVSIGECRTPLKHVLFHKRSETWADTLPRKFSLLCDSRASLLGSFGRTLKPSLLETEHPALAELLRNGFYHDLVMERIERDFGEALDAEYGPHYDSIIAPYRDIL
ncbi:MULTISPECIES: TrmB family transcriptional regulator [Paenibacillus]|uniref:TrmB family transcriptional regulator n=1 Tax=Paenibacillus TaxID=44249 RepID=UPI0022B860DA|nr:helix-turn-helix domain-containing protein [Paenibacillus caseinilyticus]MCZ8520414.1 TrmB family transcriptional regulator [Paenibacillus caseinilyticus]